MRSIKTTNVAAAIEKRVGAYITHTDPLIAHQKHIMVDESWKLKNIWENGEEFMLTAIKKNYWEQYWDLLAKYTKDGVVDTAGLIAETIVSEKNTLEKLSKLWFRKAVDFTTTGAWMTKKIDDKVKELTTALDDALESNPESKDVIMKSKVALVEWQGNMRMIPLYHHTEAGVENIKLMQTQLDDIVRTANKVISDWSITGGEIASLLDLPKEIIDNLHDPKKIAEIIFRDEAAAEWYGIKVYNMNEYASKNSEYLKQTMGKESVERLEWLMKTLDDVNRWKVKIYELPNTIKAVIKNVGWFTTFVKAGDETQLIIGTVWWLVDMAWDPKNLKNLEYVNTMCHEMGHNIMLSLNAKMRSAVLRRANSIFWWWVTSRNLKKMVPDLSKERVSVLIDLSRKNMARFIEEISADIVWSSLKSQIVWAVWDVEKNWERFLKKVTSWIFVGLEKNESVFDIVADRFVKMIKWVFDYNSKWVYADYKNMLHLISYSIAEWHKTWIDAGKAADKLKWLKFLEENTHIMSINTPPVKTQLEAVTRVEKNHSWRTYELKSTGWDTVETVYLVNFTDAPKAKEMSKQWKLDAFRDMQKKLRQTPESNDVMYYANATDGEVASTFTKGITNFDISKVYSESIVRDMIFDGNISAKDVGWVLSLNFLNPLIENNILLWADLKQVKKFKEARQIAQNRHRLAINTMFDFYDKEKGILDLEKIVNWKTMMETMKNVSAKISRDGAVSFAWQDFMKFLNLSSKEEYNKIFKLYMDSNVLLYDKKSKELIEKALDRMNVSWKTLSEKYVSFANAVEDKIFDAAKVGWDVDPKYAEELAKDVASRLFVWWPWYMSVLLKNADTIAWASFIDDIAYWLVKKNSRKASTAFYWDQYVWILDNMKAVDIERADSYAEIFWKEISLWGDAFERQSYSKQFFNFLSARTENFILNSLKSSDIAKLDMDMGTFYRYISKISGEGSEYVTVVEWKFSSLWVKEFMDLSDSINFSETDDLLDYYKKQLTENKSKISAKLWEKWYTKLFDEVEWLKGWLSDSDVSYLLWNMEKNYNQYSKWLKVDDFFSDVSNVNKTIEDRDKSSAAAKVWLEWAGNKEYIETSVWFATPEWEASVQGVLDLLWDYNKLATEIKSEWFNYAFGKIVDNDYLNTFFNVKWDWFEVKAIIKKLSSRNQTYKMEYQDEYNQAKIPVISWLAWTFWNTATVAEADKAVFKTVMWSAGEMWKSSPIKKGWKIQEYLKGKDINWSFISNKTLFDKMEEDIASAVEWWATYKKFTDAIQSVYQHTFYKKWIPAYWEELMNHKWLIDAYVEMLWRRRHNFWLYNIEKWGKNELSQIFAWIDEWSEWRWIWSKQASEMDKLLGLWWNRMGMSFHDLSKMKDKAALFNKNMFNNYLYKSFAQSEYTFSVIDTLMNWAKRLEKWVASAMYATFYSVFATWLPAAWQQVMNNATHLLWKTLSEIWAENIDNVDDMMRLTDAMAWSILLKTDILSAQPELITKMTNKSKMWQVGAKIDTLLSLQSSLTRSDKSMEAMVKKYSLTSALLESQYTAKSAEEMITNFWKMSDEFAEKWYSKYIDFDRLVMYWNEWTLNSVSYKIEKAVSQWKLTEEAWQEIINDFKRYIPDAQELKKVINNAKIKTMTFYQMSSTPELVQNVIWWKVGIMNMRFLNWASRKAGDYSFKLVDAVTKWDRKAMTKIIWQIFWEWLYATKLYMLFNNLSDWWVDKTQAMSSYRLPYTVMWMASFGVVDAIAWLVEDRWQDKELGISMWKSLKKARFDFTRWLSNRALVAPAYRTSQFFKIQNGLAMLDDKKEMDHVYQTQLWGIPFVRDFAEVFSNIIFSRLWRFDTITAWGYYRDYAWLDAGNTLMNFMTNVKITNDVVGADKLVNSFYDLTTKKEDWLSLWLNILPYSRDQRFALRAQEKFFKDEWLMSFLDWWPHVWQLLTRLEQQLDDENLEKMYIAMWWDYDKLNEITSESDTDMRVDDLALDWIFASKSKIDEIKKTSWYKTYDFFMNHLKMKGIEEQKWLYEAWKGITEKEMSEYNDSVNEMVLLVEEKILEMQKTNPKLIKNAARDDMKKLGIIEKWMNKFWEQMMLGVWIDSMVKAQKLWLKDMLKATKGKDRLKQNINDKDWEVLKFIETESWKYKKQMMEKYYNTALMWNRTLWKDLSLLYTNTSPDKPLKKELSQNVWIWTIIVPSIIQKTIQSEGISSLWVDNAFTVLNTKLWNWQSWLDEEDKWKWLESVFGYKSWIFDYISKYVSFADAHNTKVGIWAGDSWKLNLLRQNQEALEEAAEWIKNYLDVVTVSDPITDEKIIEEIEKTIFKEQWTGWSKKSRKKLNFWKLAFKMNELSNFKTDFYRNVLKQEPLSHIKYSDNWSWKILAIRMPAAEARPVKPEYSFVKMRTPEAVETPDIKIENIKTSRASKSYRWKKIKWQNVYIIKTSRWKKR